MNKKIDTLFSVSVEVNSNLERLIQDEDTDIDRKITVDDIRIHQSERGDKRFILIDVHNNGYEIVGTYYLSNLLQELKLALDAGNKVAAIELNRIFENPVHRIQRLINTLFWEGLTRQIDEKHIERVLTDEKIEQNGQRFLYVPHNDSVAFQYFSKISKSRPELRLQVERLPSKITPQYMKSIEHSHGLLSLALSDEDGEIRGVPYVVPGGRFNEMYGWDSYFIVLGLLASDRVRLAQGMVDHMVYQINHYGKILNANRTYYLTRSQPPFLTSMALAVYRRLPKNKPNKTWLRNTMCAAVREYRKVWMNRDRLTHIGLSRYYGSGLGPPPEVEHGHFDEIYQPYADERDLDVKEFASQYRQGKIRVLELDRFFQHDRAVRESGHDTTYRWWVDGDDCCGNFVTVDLNVLLYKIEIDLAKTIENEFEGEMEGLGGQKEKASDWRKRAEKRKQLIREYLWDEKDQLFYDYNTVLVKRHRYLSATTLYPLWACHSDDPSTFLVTSEEADQLLQAALSGLEMAGGLAASSEDSRGEVSEKRPQRQWDFPFGWSPHQMLTWKGLINYGYEDISQRLVYRWLYTIVRNCVDYNGTIPEKFDVIKRSHEVFVEYGNVGTKFSYMTKEGFGWMNASYMVGLSILSQGLEERLGRFIPPECIFSK